jgi:hypothetical protein
VLEGKMVAKRPGDRLEMRFDVYKRTPADPVWRLIQSPDLGIWNRAKSGTTQYTFRQKVYNLDAPASYRAKVTYHWIGANGRESTTRRWTKACEQRDPRPNLRVVRLDAAPAGKLADYVVVVRNVGAGTIAPDPGFDVALAVDGVTQPPNKSIQGLRPGERVQVNWRAPRCKPTGTLRAAADPDQRVEQSDRADDVLELPCPASLSR